jgi:hypothetical protein
MLDKPRRTGARDGLKAFRAEIEQALLTDAEHA